MRSSARSLRACTRSPLLAGLALVGLALLVLGGRAAADDVVQLEDPVSDTEGAAARARVESHYEARAASDLRLPLSNAERQVPFGVHVLVTKSSILVDGKSVVGLEPAEAGALQVPEVFREGMLVAPLYERLQQKRGSLDMLAVVLGRDSGLGYRVVVTCDGDTPYGLITQIFYTAGQAQFSDFSVVVRNPWLKQPTVLDSSLPSIATPAGSDGAAEVGQRRFVTIEVHRDGLRLVFADGAPDAAPAEDATPGDGLISSPIVLPCKSPGVCPSLGGYDWVGLHKALLDVRSLHKQRSADAAGDAGLIIAAEQSLPFDVLARAVDVARWDAAGPAPEEATGDQRERARQDWTSWRSVRKALYPHPIFAGGMQP